MRPADPSTFRARKLALGRRASAERIAEIAMLEASTIQRACGPNPVRLSPLTIELIDYALRQLEREAEQRAGTK